MEKLVCFLYILLRDEVTPGTVAAILENHVKHLATGGGAIYTNKHLEAYARELATRILK